MRVIILLAVLCISGITATQIYWFSRAFDLREDEFDRAVTTALFNVAQQIFDINDTPSPANNPVRQVSTNYFIVMVNGELHSDLLEFLLKTEFEKRNIRTNFEYGIYDCASEKMVYCNYVTLQSKAKRAGSGMLPGWSSQGYYFGVKFPHREANIINEMGIWTFSSAVLLVVIAFFCYTLFVILKQKRLSDIQKDFVNNMTHEFKTPLSTIAVSVEALRDSLVDFDKERLQNYTAIIEKENNRLTQQVERVLQAATADKGVTILKKELVSIREVITEAVRRAGSLSKLKNGCITCYFNTTVERLHADKLHLTNAVFNLIDNALKYSDKEPRIVIQIYNDKKDIVVEVQDNGPGIGNEHRRRIFDRFYRVPAGNVHNVKGFGLGLSYVKNIIEGHKGKVTVESEPGRGSTFIIFLSGAGYE